MSDSDSITPPPTNGYASTGATNPLLAANGLGNGNGHAHGLPNGGTVRKKLMGYVGFANLPNQVHRKSVRKGFQFTAMVVGAYLCISRATFVPFAVPLALSLTLSTRRRVGARQVHFDQHFVQHYAVPGKGAIATSG